jgi:drug/metabolite transporter (DMT)-like permease
MILTSEQLWKGGIILSKHTSSDQLFAFGTVVLWASAFVFTKVALTYFTASSLGVLRYLSASVVLILIAVVKKIGLPQAKDIPKFFLSGAMGFTFYMVTFNKGSQTLSSSTGSIIIATVPIMTALFARVLFRERIRLLGWVAIAIEFTGILILTLWNGVFSINSGVFWMFGAALLLSGYNLTQRQYSKKYTAFQSTAYSIFAGTLLLLIFLPEAVPQIINAPVHQIFIIIYLGIFPSAVAYVWWTKALSLAKNTSDVTNYMFVTPLLSMLLGYIVIMEVPNISTCLGGSVILFGLILFSIVNRKEKIMIASEKNQLKANSH